MFSMRPLVILSIVALSACHKSADKQPPGDKSAAAAKSGTPAPAAAGGIGITLHATLTVSGKVAGTAQFTQQTNDFSDCAAWAAKRDDFAIPRDGSAKMTGGQTVDLSDNPDHYHGPGTYAAADLDQAAATLSINGSDESYAPGKDSTRSLTVNADGSGTYTFANWIDPGGNKESGSLTWTCSK